MATFGVLMNIPEVDSKHLDAFANSFEHELSRLKIFTKVLNVSVGNKEKENKRMMFIFSDFDPDAAMSMTLVSFDRSNPSKTDLSIHFTFKEKDSASIVWDATVRLFSNAEKLEKTDFEQFGKALAMRMQEDGVISNRFALVQARQKRHDPSAEPQAYFMHIDGTQYGPYNRTQLGEMLGKQQIRLSDWAWREGESEWIALEHLLVKH